MISIIHIGKQRQQHLACAALIAACALSLSVNAADNSASSTKAKPIFTDSEIKTIVSHGPWPTALQTSTAKNPAPHQPSTAAG